MIFVFCSVSIAQTATISGIVIDASNEEPLIGASLYVKQLRHGESAGRNGYFTLSGVPAGNYSLTVSYMGYRTCAETITLRAGETRKITFRLEAESRSLGEVVVTAKSEARKLREQAMPVTVISMSQLQGTVNSVEDVLSKTMGATIRSQGGAPISFHWFDE